MRKYVPLFGTLRSLIYLVLTLYEAPSSCLRCGLGAKKKKNLINKKKRRQIDDQETHKKVLIITYQRNSSKDNSEKLSHTIKNGICLKKLFSVFLCVDRDVKSNDHSLLIGMLFKCIENCRDFSKKE